MTLFLLAFPTWQAIPVEYGTLGAALLALIGTAINAWFTHRGKQGDLTQTERRDLMDTAEQLRKGLLEEIERRDRREVQMRREIDYLRDRMNWQEEVNAALRRSLRAVGVSVADLELPPYPRRPLPDGDGEGDA